jgi:hypothetical protein
MAARKARHVMSRTRARLRPGSEHRHNGRYLTKEDLMAKYLLLKHYRSASQPAPIACEPMDRWTPEEVSAHIQYMSDVRQHGVRRGRRLRAGGLGQRVDPG